MRRVLPVVILVAMFVGIPVGIIGYESWRTGGRWGDTVRRMVSRAGSQRTGLETFGRMTTPVGKRVEFVRPEAIGEAADKTDYPVIAHVRAVDLDGDGLLDVLVCEAQKHYVSWIRQHPAGQFTERRIGERVNAPAHAEPYDMDGDGDLDILVASMGTIFPSNDKVGAVVILENLGEGEFRNRVVSDRAIARVTDVRGGDLTGNALPDLAVALFGYDDGETQWLENMGDWRFKRHVLQTLSGPINSEIVDMDNDGDLDIVVLVSQEWEEIYIHENDGTGRFRPRLVYGSTNEDFGSSWLTCVDMDGDGLVDILYSNGDAFDYLPPRPRPWHGVQWLKNFGGLKFEVRRIGDFPGASSPVAADVDRDGHLDVVVASAYNFWERPDAFSLTWFRNDGEFRFTRHDVARNPTHIVTLGVGDFNGDGWLDFVTGGLHVYPPYDRLGRVTLWLHRGPEALGEILLR